MYENKYMKTRKAFTIKGAIIMRKNSLKHHLLGLIIANNNTMAIQYNTYSDTY